MALAVSVARCADYEVEAVRSAVHEMLAPLGGMPEFAKPGERIALKPNLLTPAAPERAVITHPAVIAAVALEVLDAGAFPVLVESPGTGIVPVPSVIERAFRRAGYKEAAERYGFELSLDTAWKQVACPEARWGKRMEIMTPILEADGVINLPKLKTHSFMTVTAATKNLFGVVPGLNKAAYHAKLADRSRFADMLLDLAYFIKARLHVVDGVLAMEGDGPGMAGTPRPLGVLLAGSDPVAVDSACCRVTGIDWKKVPVLVQAVGRGLWSGRPEDIATLGVPVEEVAVTDFQLPGPYEGIGVGRFGPVDPFIRRILRGFNRMPRPKAERCTLCGACEQACPGKAISMDKGAKVARVDDSLCIRCYCCHEVCPAAAIDLEFSGLGRLMHELGLVK
jgi:uncharacterized protein (DUF362 family)/Pyruvate/2-oxoacid:ferredoxin oxidoreductase delta subunit